MRRHLLSALFTLGVVGALASTASAAVLLVGSYHGIQGQYTSVVAAVHAAKPGDWILIGPGDYKTPPSAITTPAGKPQFPAGVLITTPNLHIRGMNRNTVIIDGTKPGSAVCSRSAAAQNFGLNSADPRSATYGVVAATQLSGVNGLMVYKAANVSIQNLTSCNFLGGSGEAGNEIWWNGGANSGQVGGHGYLGSYLSATSTFYENEHTAAQYGIFSSNWDGGTWDQTYASNFNDSGYYIGACRQICNQVMNHAHAEFNALGYSGTNSGGAVVIENSEFDNNEDGLDTNSQNADFPPPQNGACPGGTSAITHTHSCWVFFHNFVHDNNNPNVPSSGSAAAGPVGTGMSISGGRNDTVMDNRFVNNKAWGVIFVPYVDSGPPCTGGTRNNPIFGQGSCLYDQWGLALIGNTFTGNGTYGHPSNGDVGQVNLESGHPTNCYRGNQAGAGGTLSPDLVALQIAHPVCDGSPGAAGGSNPNFLAEVLCDSQISIGGGKPAGCPSGQYPRRTHVEMHPLPAEPTMPFPCKGVPANAWCTRTSGFG
jgi:hypothetical protein